MVASFSLAAVMAANIWSMTVKSIVVFIIAKFLCSVRYASGHSLHVRVTLNFAGVIYSTRIFTDFHGGKKLSVLFRVIPCSFTCPSLLKDGAKVQQKNETRKFGSHIGTKGTFKGTKSPVLGHLSPTFRGQNGTISGYFFDCVLS